MSSNDRLDGHMTALFEHSPIPMLVLDRDRVVRRANRSAMALGVAETAQICGVAVKCRHGLGDPGSCGSSRVCKSCALRTAVLDTFTTDSPQLRREVRLRRTDGMDDILLLVSAVPFGPVEDGLVVVSLEDITERRKAEEDLKASRQGFHNIVERTDTGIVVTDADLIVRYVNPAGCRLLGRSAAAMVGQEAGFPIHKGACSKLVLASGKGPKRVVESQVAETRWQRRSALLITLRDETERHAAEQALRDSRERLALVIKGSSDGIWDWNIPTSDVYFSPRWKNMLGYTDLEVDNTFNGWERLLHPDDRERAMNALRAYFEGITDRYELEHRLRHKDGTYRWILARGVVQRDAQGRPVRMAGSHVDLTERKLAEEALRTSAERFEMLANEVPVGIFETNAQGDCTYVNERWCELTGLSWEEAEGTGWTRALHPEDYDRVFERWNECAREGVEFALEYRFLRPDGDVCFVAGHAGCLRDGAGHVRGYVGSVMDITERRNMEQRLLTTCEDLARSEGVLRATVAELSASNTELKDAQLQLIQAAKMESVGTLAAGVAHEVKNPLQIILMGLRYLENNIGSNDCEHLSVINDMRDAVRRADSIVRGLLEFSVSYHLDLRPESLEAVIRASLELVRYELIKSHVQIQEELAPDLPPIELDRIKVEQVLVNLFMNAIHAMPDGGTLMIRTRAAGDDGYAVDRQCDERSATAREVVLQVADTGCGIPPERFVRIFDPFYTTKTVGKGSGLGLTVVKRIVDLHGGTIELCNRPEGGTLVTLRFRGEGRDVSPPGRAKPRGEP